MRTAATTVSDRLRQSLFVVPVLGMLAGVGLGLGLLTVDRAVGPAVGVPLVLTSTVESGRTMLGTIATATISVAGIAFSVSLLILQQASAQFSPRVVHGLFRDPFNRRVMAVALGTFSYSLTVLRAVRAPEDSGTAVVVPNLSIAVAQLLGLVAIVAIVALIDHIAHTMEVSTILGRVLHEARAVPGERDTRPGGNDGAVDEPGAPALQVRADRDGWVQHLDRTALLDLVPDGGQVRLDTGVGRFVMEGTPLLSLWPEPDDPDRVAERARATVLVGATRTLLQDPTYGLRQLVDVALIALSPGVNDATTAQDAVLHAGALLRTLLVHPLPRVHRDDRGRALVLLRTPSAAELVELTFAEVRRAAAPLPAVGVYLLECLHDVRRSLPAEVREDPEIAGALAEQARLVVEGAARADLLDPDLAGVRAAHDRYFGQDARDPG